MGFQVGPVGPRALALLAATAVAGVLLAAHGWSARHAGLGASSLGGAHSRAAAPGASPAPSPRTPGRSPAASPGPAVSHSPAASPGPLLSSQSYASFSYLVWPGTLSTAARAALTGLSVSVRKSGAGISVVAGVNGQPPAAPQFYRGGARVYIVEASLSDDSGNSDYNLGDDALVVTDAQSRILR